MAKVLGICFGFLLVAESLCSPFISKNGKGLLIDTEDPLYLYESMASSVKAYELARDSAKLGLHRDGSSHVCYGDLGCFYKNGTYSNFWMLPYTPEYINTKFQLYTSAAQEIPQLLDYKDPTSFAATGFRSDWMTVLLVPGFGNKPTTDWLPEFKAAVFRHAPETNYVMVDWTAGAAPPNYWAASTNTQVVGAQIAKLIMALNTNMATQSDSFHIVGYSLGAHVAGFTKHRLELAGHKKVGKISGLDPAGPIFEDGHGDATLNSDDADFVSGFHSNGATLTNGGFGLFRRVGHIDFYPNGGQYQPGCPHAIWGALSNLLSFNFWDLPESVKCNHHRAVALAIEALDPHCMHHSYACEDYKAFKEGNCDTTPDGNMAVFGSHVASELPHFLVTKDADGYCANALKITLAVAPTSDSDASGNIFVTFVGSNGKEETTEQLAFEEDFKPSTNIVEVVASRFEAQSVKQVKIKYEADCGWFSCSSDSLTINSITVMNLANDGNKLCGGYHILYKDDTVIINLATCEETALS